MGRAVAFICAIVFLALLWAVMAYGQGLGQSQGGPPCKPYAPLIAELSGKYGEVMVATDTTPTSRMELWISPARSWTLVVVLPNDMACMMAAGKNIQFTKPPTTDKDT